MGKPLGSKFDKFLDGRKHRIKFDNYTNHKNIESLRTSIHCIAKKRGLKLNAKIDRENGVLIVKATPIEEAV